MWPWRSALRGAGFQLNAHGIRPKRALAVGGTHGCAKAILRGLARTSGRMETPRSCELVVTRELFVGARAGGSRSKKAPPPLCHPALNLAQTPLPCSPTACLLEFLFDPKESVFKVIWRV